MDSQRRLDNERYYEAQLCCRLACASVAMSGAPMPMHYSLSNRIVDVALLVNGMPSTENRRMQCAHCGVHLRADEGKRVFWFGAPISFCMQACMNRFWDDWTAAMRGDPLAT